SHPCAAREAFRRAMRARSLLDFGETYCGGGKSVCLFSIILMKYILVFHPAGTATRSKSVPDGFVVK
ncbi:MAG: hypothetical protein ACRERV_13680, partial [Methylococcales bacterium]